MGRFTEKEKDIIALVIQEKNDIEIAEEVGYSESNVKKKLQKLYKIFKVKTRQGLVREALLMQFAQDL